MQTERISPSLQRSKRFATIALVVAVLIWLALMMAAKLLPEYVWLLQILMLSAEAGVVGGLADWYAITVLFRNPFGRLPIPKFYVTTPKLFHATRPGLQNRWAVLSRKIFFLHKLYSAAWRVPTSVWPRGAGWPIHRTMSR